MVFKNCPSNRLKQNTKESQNDQKTIPLTSSPYQRSSKVITDQQSFTKAITSSQQNDFHQNESF